MHYTALQLQLPTQLQLQTQQQLQLHYANYTIYTTATTRLHHNYNYNCTTSSSCGWGDHCNHCNHSKNTAATTFRSISGFALPSGIHNNQPLLWVSYFSASATALCGTSGSESMNQWIHVSGNQCINHWMIHNQRMNELVSESINHWTSESTNGWRVHELINQWTDDSVNHCESINRWSSKSKKQWRSESFPIPLIRSKKRIAMDRLLFPHSMDLVHGLNTWNSWVWFAF